MPLRVLLALLAAGAIYADIVDETREAISQGDLARAESMVEQYRSRNGVTPEMIEALSWLGRGALASGQLEKAVAFGERAQELADAQLKHRALDAEPRLPLALGAAIEVRSQAMAKQGERGLAVNYLRKELAAYRDTSIRARIQKNINLLSLEGRPAPPLEESIFIGPKPVPLAALQGKPVLLFFWAHWCADCKAEAPILSQIRREYSPKGLVVVGPTQRYGYVAGGVDATPADELKYTDQVRRQYYAGLLDVPVPVSEENFKNYGASTTPTLVMIDRHGVVRLYHPGAMTYQELTSALRRVL
jgi:thiol-disulfide isomerase/thioredoxin